MKSTATQRAWDALVDTLHSLSSATLVRIARGDELMPNHSGIRVLIARNRLDVVDLCRMALAWRGEGYTGRFIGSVDAALVYLRDTREQQQQGHEMILLANKRRDHRMRRAVSCRAAA